MGTFGIGQAPRRAEDQGLRTGRGRFRNDMPATPGWLRRAIRQASGVAAP